MSLFSAFKVAFITLCLGLLCTNTSHAQTVKDDMHSIAGISTELFNYAWNEKKFDDPASKARIIALLNKLSTDFHDVRKDAPITMFEPGFSVSLETMEQTLSDIKYRFEEGDKDYARWQLRGMTANCISCHSRLDVKNDFALAISLPTDNSFEARLASAEFLMATRQFDKASDALYRVASGSGQAFPGQHDAFRALKLWLVIETRVKDRPEAAIAKLQQLQRRDEFSEEQIDAMKQWIEDLPAVKKSKPSIENARAFLKVIQGSETVQAQEKHLVTTLTASEHLHTILSGEKLKQAELKQAMHLLARAYNAIPILSFEVYRPLYLERVIRLFPKTPEAREAFVLYQEHIEFMNSGSGGVHLSNNEVERLRELRHLAFGKPELVIPDTFRFDGAL